MSTQVFTVKELADYLKAKPVTIYKHLSEGKIPAFKLGKSWRFVKAYLIRWLEEGARIR